jgi:hypothetical protein
MKISRELKRRLRDQVGAATEASFRDKLRNMTPEEYESHLARAQASL